LEKLAARSVPMSTSLLAPGRRCRLAGGLMKIDAAETFVW
jgi:hypothetical protein